jgi:hypothetical protein
MTGYLVASWFETRGVGRAPHHEDLDLILRRARSAVSKDEADELKNALARIRKWPFISFSS